MKRTPLFLLPFSFVLAASVCRSQDSSDTDPRRDRDAVEKTVSIDTGSTVTSAGTTSQCEGPFFVQDTSGTFYRVQTRPHFARSSDSPTGTITSGGDGALFVDITADVCGHVSITHLVFHLSCSDNAGTGWANNILSEVWRFQAKVEDEPETLASWWLYDLDPGDATKASGVVEFNPPINIAAGKTSKILIDFDSTGASELAGDWVQVIQDPRLVWYGQDDPSSYPPEGWLDDELPIEGDVLMCQDP